MKCCCSFKEPKHDFLLDELSIKFTITEIKKEIGKPDFKTYENNRKIYNSPKITKKNQLYKRNKFLR